MSTCHGVSCCSLDYEQSWRDVDLPSCGQWVVRKAEEPDDGDQECDNSLEDEQPLPSRETGSMIHSMENARSNQASKCSCQNISSI